MVLGAVWLPLDKAREVAERIREIKEQHGVSRWYEMKWTKVSPSKVDLYRNIIDYFFDDDDFHFRCLVVPDKSLIVHSKFNQNHNDWYYEMYFNMLKAILKPDARYRTYIDIKDTLGGDKVKKLHQVLCNSVYDFDKKIIERLQLVRSHEIEMMQIVDILIGAISYLHRNLESSAAKQALIERIQKRSGYSLRKNTLMKENKFNILIWSPHLYDNDIT